MKSPDQTPDGKQRRFHDPHALGSNPDRKHHPFWRSCLVGSRAPVWRRWLLGNSLVAGILALCWLVLRSGTKPSRLTYPCQQAAMSTAALTLGLPLTTAAAALRRRVAAPLRWPVRILAVALATVAVVGLVSSFPGSRKYSGPVLSAPGSYRADLFNVVSSPVKPVGDRFLGLDNLIALMGRQGLKFYESATESLASGPGGIIDSDDLVIIKINYQWSQRGGTNVDLLSGLIRRIVDHPDGFTGEIVICENAQFVSVENFDRAENNARDHARSPHDVVVDFQTLGYNISHYDWTSIREVSVGEYSDGDLTDGYIVHDYNPEVGGYVSYPKFQTDAGTYISLRFGVWDPIGETYSREHLKFINVPVLKSHSAAYGATVAVKNYMGVVTNSQGTQSHDAVATGILGALLGEIHLADLNIVDAIFINANPNTGPATTYVGATRRKELVACRDPIAADIWSVKNILIPAFIANGFSPPWPTPSADPDDSTSEFREYLDNSMYQILAAGDTVTNDLGQIDAVTANGSAGDFDEDADVDSADYDQFALCFTGPGGGPVGVECSAGDFDDDGDVDCDDWVNFQFVWTDSAEIPAFPGCGASGVNRPGDDSPLAVSSLGEAFPNPMRQAARIRFTVGRGGPVRLRIFDMSGRAVRTLIDDDRSSGEYSVIWNRQNDDAKPVAGGVYFCRLDAPGWTKTRKIVVWPQ